MTATLDQILAYGRVIAACRAVDAAIDSLAEVGDPLSEADMMLAEIVSSTNMVNDYAQEARLLEIQIEILLLDTPEP